MIKIRFLVLIMIYMAAYVNYIFTVNMALSIISMVKSKKNTVPYCKKDDYPEGSNQTHELPDYGPRYDWDEHTQGLILGAYFWSHSIFALPAGPLSEAIGSDKVIFYSNLIAFFLNSLCVYAAKLHWAVLAACRFLLGVVGATIYPALQCLIGQWAPPHERGMFVAGLLGNTWAAVITWPLVGTVTTHFGWNWGFHVVSIQILLFALLFRFLVSSSPEEHRYITEQELDYIKKSQGDSVAHSKRKAPYKKILTNRPFWILCILHFGNLWGLYVQIQGVPKYMAEVIGFNLQSAGMLGAMPSLVRFFTSVSYGLIVDYIHRKELVSTKVVRKGFVLASHIIPGILMFSISFTGCHYLPVIILLTLSMSINGAVVVTNLQNPQDLAPNFAGTIFGIITCIDGTTGFIVPFVTAQLIHKNNGLTEWGYVFMIAGCMYVICGTTFILFGSVEEQSWNRIT